MISAALIAAPALAQGKGGGKGGGGGGGGGGTTAAYTIVDLPGPYHEVNGGSSQTRALRISDADTDGTVYVLGDYGVVGLNAEPCVWTVSPEGTVAVADLTGQLDLVIYADINSAGIIATERDFRPMLLLPDGTNVFFADEAVTGRLFGLTNPDANGVFQVVGSLSVTPHIWALWNVDIAGNILSQTVLGEASVAGWWGMIPYAISDSLFLGGSALGPPAVGAFDGDGQLQIDVLSFPEGIDGAFDYRIDDAGNLLAYGYKQAETGTGQYPRAVIWPASGGVIDVTAHTGFANTEGNDIALVDGEMKVVGYAFSSGSISFAYLFTDGSLVDLNPLSQGAQPWKLQRAEGVNSSGMICGQGRVGQKKNFQIHGFVLIPNTP